MMRLRLVIGCLGSLKEDHFTCTSVPFFINVTCGDDPHRLFLVVVGENVLNQDIGPVFYSLICYTVSTSDEKLLNEVHLMLA